MALTGYLKQTNGVVFPPGFVILEEEQIENNFFVPPPFPLPVVEVSGLYSGQHDDRISAQIMDMAQHYGIFQIINHGIKKHVLTKAMTAANTFFELPSHELKKECERCGFYTSSFIHHCIIEEGGKYWRDTLLFYLSSPKCLWPHYPLNFTHDVSQFASALERLANKLIVLISKRLGLSESYCPDRRLSEVRRLNVNRYPRCPNPKLTCGLPKHCDPDLLTITYVEAGDAAHGLEVRIDNEWKRVAPRDGDALIVTIGSQLQVVSNKKLKAPLHRVVVNSRWDRTSICYAVAPHNNAQVEPADELTRTQPAHYRSFRYEDYLTEHVKNYRDTSGVLPSFEIRNWV